MFKHLKKCTKNNGIIFEQSVELCNSYKIFGKCGKSSPYVKDIRYSYFRHERFISSYFEVLILEGLKIEAPIFHLFYK